MTSPWLMIGSCCCCILIILCCIFCCYGGMQEAMNNYVEKEETQVLIKPSLGFICPNDWTSQKFTDGTYCVKSGYIAITDDKGNVKDQTPIKGNTCPTKTQTINGNEYCVAS